MSSLFGKVKSGLAVFKHGKKVSNPAAWKRGEITIGAVALLLGALVALAESFGIEVPLDTSDLTDLAGVIVPLAMVLLPLVSSDTVGVPGLSRADNGGDK